jgi:hypothetical protein
MSADTRGRAGDLTTEAFQAATAHGDPALSYLDVDGWPASVRVALARDGDTLVAALPVGAPPAAAGPANLLAHAHDEDLWDLRQTMVRGHLDVDGEVVRFTPDRIVPGSRPGIRAQLEVIRRCRRNAADELARRGLGRPTVPWDDVRRVAERAAAER